MRINDIFDIYIEKQVFGGEGLGYYQGLVVFVPMAIKGEKVRVKIISVKKDYARGLIQEILEKSSSRVCNKKISFTDFNGCDYAMMDYETQLNVKEEIVKEEFKKNKIYNYKYLGIIRNDNEFNYRNKISEPFVRINGRITTGFYEKKTHKIFEFTDDLLISKVALEVKKELLSKLNEFNKSYKMMVYKNDIEHKGLKHLIIRNNTENEVMVVLVISTNIEYKQTKQFLDYFIKESKKILQNKGIYLKSICISIKNKVDNVILGNQIICIYGKEYISQKLFDITYKIYPLSFFQVNTEQTIKLYQVVLDYLKEVNSKYLIDAYAGAGTISMLVSKKVETVIAIENNKQACKAAVKSAKENNIENIYIINENVEHKDNIQFFKQADTVIFDPPRKGIDKSILNNLYDVQNIIYVSCDLLTLVRDLKILINKGYKVDKVTIVDMFSQTHHVECIVLLTKAY